MVVAVGVAAVAVGGGACAAVAAAAALRRSCCCCCGAAAAAAAAAATAAGVQLDFLCFSFLFVGLSPASHELPGSPAANLHFFVLVGQLLHRLACNFGNMSLVREDVLFLSRRRGTDSPSPGIISRVLACRTGTSNMLP